MPLTVTAQANPLGSTIVQQTTATATPDQNATGAAGTLHLVDIDNTANGAIVYVKIYDLAGGVVVGTTAPDWIFRVPPSVRRSFAIPVGVTLLNGFSFAATQEAGTAGNTSPAGAVIVRLLTGP